MMIESLFLNNMTTNYLCKKCLICFVCIKCLCCKFCSKCHQCVNCVRCEDCDNCLNCTSCEHCINCTHQVYKKFMINNKYYPEEAYYKIVGDK